MLIFLISLVILADLVLIYQIYREIRLRKELEKQTTSPTPSDLVSIIIPIRGKDPQIEENVLSLLNQDHPSFEVIYVVDNLDDESVEVLKRLGVKIVVNEVECTNCSNKIKAQLTGIKYANGKIIVFADSDTRYPKFWLRKLVRPLYNGYVASTTFSWPKPLKYSLSNLLRAGFWTLGFESQAVGGTFLWGGSMAFKREFFDSEVIRELKNEWCDDCTLTRIAKRRGSIDFVFSAIPLNIYDEKNLILWSKRQIITVRKYSPRGFYGFLIISFFLTLFLVLFILTMNLIFLSPYILWFLKNVNRGFRTGYALIPSFFSLLSIFFAFFLSFLILREKYIFWRGVRYKV
ncbi:MAG: glycosyltransferase family 2 protein [Sulfolobus sp.]